MEFENRPDKMPCDVSNASACNNQKPSENCRKTTSPSGWKLFRYSSLLYFFAIVFDCILTLIFALVSDPYVRLIAEEISAVVFAVIALLSLLTLVRTIIALLKNLHCPKAYLQRYIWAIVFALIAVALAIFHPLSEYFRLHSHFGCVI